MSEIIHIDIAAFAVAVECVVHPDLRRRPVVVAPVGPSRSIVMALSSEAQQWGIRKGMILARAQRLCRGLVVLPPNEPLYARAVTWSRPSTSTTRLLKKPLRIA
jgi:DNA polymerase-4